MAALVRYFTFESATGRVAMRGSAPEAKVPAAAPDGHGLVIVRDGGIPLGPFRVDRRKVAKSGATTVETLDAVLLAPDKSQTPTAEAEFAYRVDVALGDLDRRSAAAMDAVRGPLAAMHAEKRRQAEAGPYDPATMPLVADEADRLAILRRAEGEDVAVAAIERARRERKAALKAATTEDEITAALKAGDGKEGWLA